MVLSALALPVETVATSSGYRVLSVRLKRSALSFSLAHEPLLFSPLVILFSYFF